MSGAIQSPCPDCGTEIGHFHYVADCKRISSLTEQIETIKGDARRWKAAALEVERCPECSGELSYCGEMTADGPALDCLACQLRATITAQTEELERLRALSATLVHAVDAHINTIRGDGWPAPGQRHAWDELMEAKSAVLYEYEHALNAAIDAARSAGKE